MKTRDRLLAVLCVLGEADQARASAAVAALAREPWDEVDRLLARHRVAGAFLHRVQVRGLLAGLPTDLRQACRRRAQAVLARNLAHLAERDRVLAALAPTGIPVLVLKGAALIDVAYPSPGYRPLSDLDLLTDPADVPAIGAALARLGYRADAPDTVGDLAAGRRLETGFSLATGTGHVDLHVAVKRTSAHAGGDIAAALWRDARPFRGVGGAIRQPAPAAHLLYLVTHAMLQHALTRMRQLVDVHVPLAWWRNDPAWVWNDTVDLAAELALTDALDTALVICDRLLDARHAGDRGLDARRIEAIWQATAAEASALLLSDASEGLEHLVPLSDYWAPRHAGRALVHLVARASLLRAGSPGTTVRVTPPLAPRLAFRLRVLGCCLRRPRTAWRFLRLQARLRRANPPASEPPA